MAPEAGSFAAVGREGVIVEDRKCKYKRTRLKSIKASVRVLVLVDIRSGTSVGLFSEKHIEAPCRHLRLSEVRLCQTICSVTYKPNYHCHDFDQSLTGAALRPERAHHTIYHSRRTPVGQWPDSHVI